MPRVTPSTLAAMKPDTPAMEGRRYPARVPLPALRPSRISASSRTGGAQPDVCQPAENVAYFQSIQRGGENYIYYRYHTGVSFNAEFSCGFHSSLVLY